MNHLHPPVIFIGDRPNPKKNLDMEVPFVGTKSYKVLLEWIYRMDLFIPDVQLANAYTVTGQPRILDWIPYGFRVITLGAEAREAFKASRSMAQSFALPHPSGRNPELNDKKKLAEALTRCRAFIYKQD